MKNSRKQIAQSITLFCIALVISPVIHSQTSLLPGGIDEYFRRSQLLSQGNVQTSLTVRSYSRSLEGMDTLQIIPKSTKIKTGASSFALRWLPIETIMQYNSHHPYGWNDGAMIPARGFSTKISAGIQARVGRLVIQLQPEFVISENRKFETFFAQQYDTTWSRYYKWLNRSDIPERFGNGIYNKIFPGQSSIRYELDNFSFAVSTENLWWGPGTRNALVMSNNAPGFLHGSFSTRKPYQTRIGSFEWQVIGGRLTGSDILPPETNRVYVNGSSVIYTPKPAAARYMTGMVLSWQPKWVKGLFIGFAKASYQYRADITLMDLLLLEGIIRSPSEKNGRKASLGSLFARYVMPEEKAELYMEYGRSDKAPNLINLVADNAYPRAYVAGMRKLFSSKHKSFIEFSAEFTQMQLPRAELIRAAESWYTHGYVRQGYTNNGQVIGAGIGPGSNSQMLSIAWVNGIKRVGILFERIVRNNDFYYNAFEESKDFRRHWTDMSTTISADWPYKRFLASARVTMIRSLNYQWWYFDYLPLTINANYFKNGYDVLNFHANISFSYRL